MSIKNINNQHRPSVVPSPREVAIKGHPGTTVKELVDEMNKTHDKALESHKTPSQFAQRFKNIMRKLNVL